MAQERLVGGNPARLSVQTQGGIPTHGLHVQPNSTGNGTVPTTGNPNNGTNEQRMPETVGSPRGHRRIVLARRPWASPGQPAPQGAVRGRDSSLIVLPSLEDREQRLQQQQQQQQARQEQQRQQQQQQQQQQRQQQRQQQQTQGAGGTQGQTRTVRRIRIQPNRANGANQTIRIGPNGSVSVSTNGANRTAGSHQSVQVPPLRSQPLPRQNFRERSSNNGLEDSDRYNCPICFEFLQRPAGCGNCSSRFCYECISRIASSSDNARCPTCRAEIDDIVRDTQREQEMRLRATTIPYQYAACNESFLPSDLARHEEQCQYCEMRCRFATMGCKWTGFRKDVKEHERTECPYARISGFVEHTRTFQAQHEQRLNQVQQRVSHGWKAKGLSDRWRPVEFAHHDVFSVNRTIDRSTVCSYIGVSFVPTFCLLNTDLSFELPIERMHRRRAMLE